MARAGADQVRVFSGKVLSLTLGEPLNYGEHADLWRRGMCAGPKLRGWLLGEPGFR